MIKRIGLFLIGLLFSLPVLADFTDLKFGRYQVADTQWNVSSCMYTNTCQIYSKQPGVAYKIPWTSGQLSWATGDYIKFELSGNNNYPYTARQYSSNGTLKSTLGSGKILNMGTDYFFFLGSDNNTGQLFSGTVGMSGTSGVSWTGTLNPTTTQVNTMTSNYSSEPLASGTTYTAAPSLCCGGSSQSFNADANNTAKVLAFVSRTSADSKVYVEQIGSFNTITVEQTGTRNNYAKYMGNGDSNTVSIVQRANVNSQTNYTDLAINGSSNNVDIKQRTSSETNAFGKGVFATISGNSNSLIVDQKNSGNHYAEINLSGGSKTVDLLQQGSAAHMAKITLSGQPVGLNLSQSGATQQFYSINYNCATAGGCQAITVQQGQ